MILVVFFMSVLSFAQKVSTALPVCPERFHCPALAPFKYQFYNVADTRCGLIKVNCTSKGGEIQIGGRTYEIVTTFSFHSNSSSISIRNITFEQLVKNKSCEALMNNFTSPSSPSPLLYSILIRSFINITLFKCKNNLTYFEEQKYFSYNKCNNHTFYYKYSNGTVPSNLPHSCQVVQLPVKVQNIQGFDEANIFSFLYPGTDIFFNLSNKCSKCQKERRLCDIKNAHDVQCLDVKWVKQGKHDSNWMIKILVIIGSTLILMLSLIIFIIFRRRKNNPFSYVSSKKKPSSLEDISLSCGVSIFSYKELIDATQNFGPSHELGDGGFGAVYYGKLKDGREVAVKKLYEHNYNRVKQFRNEVEILTKLRHPNLVVLYGCTSRQSSELLLVYEYVPNGTVADHLHGEQASPNLRAWPIRMNIAIETASALVYLHASEIIHRDVKTTNILLDNNFCVKVADFGLSRLVSNNVTHVSTAPQGTPGYVDPQYHQHYQLTDKSDVYSFGVVLIELISSMVAVDLNRSKDEISLANLALKKIQRCEIEELIDPILVSDKNPEITNMITLVAELAFRCLQYDSDMRPTMSEVFDALMTIQAVGRIDAYDNTIDLQTVKVAPLTEANDSLVLLKDFLRSPVSIASGLSMKNNVNT